MVVTLTTAAKNWLATNAGVGNCFSPSGVSYVVDGTIHVGSTGDVVNAFFVSHLVGLDTTIVIANTDYNGFKTINGGADIGFDDVNFAYTHDGTTIGIPAYCTPPANVISATLTVDTHDCVEPCTVNGAVSWTNTGGSPSIPTDLSISYNGNSIPVASATIINPGETLSYTFSIPGLTAGSYTVQASPNAGTTPQTITVRAPANIIATVITPSMTTCPAPCNLTVDISWTNNGGVSGTFVPTITVDGTPTTLSSESLDPGQSITRTFPLTGLIVGDHTICAIPNTLPCVIVSVTVSLTSVHITSTPSGATIYIDDIIKPDVTPATITGLTEGLHTYRLTHADCDNEATGQFTTVVGTVVEVSATFDTSARFTSAPSGARIWIDGVNTGIDTPGTVTGLTPGSHTYKLTLATYADVTGSFTVAVCKRKNITASISKFKEAGLGTFMIAGLVIGAILFGKKEKKKPEKEKLTYY